MNVRNADNNAVSPRYWSGGQNIESTLFALADESAVKCLPLKISQIEKLFEFEEIES